VVLGTLCATLHNTVWQGSTTAVWQAGHLSIASMYSVLVTQPLYCTEHAAIAPLLNGAKGLQIRDTK